MPFTVFLRTLRASCCLLIASLAGIHQAHALGEKAHADMRLKERALAHATDTGVVPPRYRAPDPVLAFLESL